MKEKPFNNCCWENNRKMIYFNSFQNIQENYTQRSEKLSLGENSFLLFFVPTLQKFNRIFHQIKEN